MQWFDARYAKAILSSKTGLCLRNSVNKCNSCGCDFIIGDSRINSATELMCYTCVLFYSLGKANCRFLARLFDVSPATTYQWTRKTATTLGEPVVSAGVKEIEIDEMWHFLHSKKTKDGSSKLWTVTHGELSPGLSVVVMLQRSEDYIASSNTWMIVFSIQTIGMLGPKSCRQRDSS